MHLLKSRGVDGSFLVSQKLSLIINLLIIDYYNYYRLETQELILETSLSQSEEGRFKKKLYNIND